MLLPGEQLCMVIALGYGANAGVPHKSKSIHDVVASKGEIPEWFRKGIEAALLAPTAMNQQKFKAGIRHGEVVLEGYGRGFYMDVDLGILKYHFEAGSGRKISGWPE